MLVLIARILNISLIHRYLAYYLRFNTRTFTIYYIVYSVINTVGIIIWLYLGNHSLCYTVYARESDYQIVITVVTFVKLVSTASPILFPEKTMTFSKLLQVLKIVTPKNNKFKVKFVFPDSV